VDGKHQNYPYSQFLKKGLDYSWNPQVGMFGRFGHIDEKSQEVIDARKKFHISRSLSERLLTKTPVFMPYEELQKSEQQIHDPGPMIGAHGTSVYVSGKQPIEGGFVMCCNNGLAHISVMMFCDTATGNELEGIAGSGKIDAIRAKLRGIKDAESVIAVLDNIKL
jgi:hypothetical protein